MTVRPAKKMRLSDVPVKYLRLNCMSTPPTSPVRQGSGTKISHVFGPIVILCVCVCDSVCVRAVRECECVRSCVCLSSQTNFPRIRMRVRR